MRCSSATFCAWAPNGSVAARTQTRQSSAVFAGPSTCGSAVRSSSHAMRATLWRAARSEEHTSELQSHLNLVCRLLLEKKKKSSTQLIYRTYKLLGGCNKTSFVGSMTHSFTLWSLRRACRLDERVECVIAPSICTLCES